MSQFIHITLWFLLSHMFCGVLAQHCTEGTEASIFGWKLQRHIYKTMTANFGHECLLICRQDNRCQSFNRVISLNMCEFSNRTKQARPEDFVPDPDRYYYGRVMNRVPLGSIPDLPGETCKEIKASEGEATSKKYWLSTIKPGSSLLAYCDTKTEDVDECTASSPVCDVNAQCTNTRGSFTCTCKLGFTGDGKTCKDINECRSVPSVCDVNANCQNNIGSYLCTCKPGFLGDGKTCKGWSLIARFANSDSDTKRWMLNTGSWWYDRTTSYGRTTDPSHNADMIAPVFWLLKGNELKITRNDDSQHTALLQTTGNCLGGQTFRSKITSYGNFRNGAIWTSDQCLGNCTVQYGGQYLTTEGFQQATCNGNIQSANAIGFWCDWSGGDGAVMMIGGGGTRCSRADHGIGITEANEASFDDDKTSEYDFGHEAKSSQVKTYSLNLWVR